MPYRLTERGLERREAMRARIMTSASALFAIQGYQATTLRQVVEQAGTSIGNCFFYFVNKEALLGPLVAETSAELVPMIEPAPAELPPGPGPAAHSAGPRATQPLC